MSAEAGPSHQPQSQPQVAQVAGGKKRKRTGKEREERKAAAIAAAQAQAETAAGVKENESAANQDTAAQVDAAATAAATTAVDIAELEKRLPRALRHLRQVFKRAKTIEVTRLIKKIKQQRTKGAAEVELADLEAQRQLLSHIDLSAVLCSHLLANLRKHRHFKRSPDSIPPPVIRELSAASTSGGPAPAAGEGKLRKKVENRLCSSKTAASEVKNAIAWLLSEEGAKLGAGAIHPPVVASTAGKAKPASLNRVSQPDGDAEDEDEDEDAVAVPRRVVADSDSDDEGEGDDDGWESGSISGGEIGGRGIAPADSESDSDDDGDDDAISVSPPPKPVKKAKPAPAPAAASAPKKQAAVTTSSTFLPSLSVGFTRGGSDDSDPDDDTGEGLEDVIGKGKPAERKNRRGQRARQLIWERKYGKNAKHVQKAKQQELEGNIAHAYGKRAGTGGPGAGGRPASAATPSVTLSTPATAPAPAPAAKASQAGLHPSWEAARLRKQKEAAGPKATKIVFD